MLPIYFILVFSVFYEVSGDQLRKLRVNHQAQQLPNSDIEYLAGLSNVKYTKQVLNNILIPRVVGTENHTKVFEYIKNELRKLNWNVEVDEFEDFTPRFGPLKFKNIVATLNPNADRYLVLACHYDSKYFESGEFVGAVDSAVPCAMMLNLAKVMKNDLEGLRNNNDVNLKLIFFDGEEAFVNWGPNDSIYGAKHLAELYENSLRTVSTGETVSEIQQIDLLVLLDLIGHKGTRFYNNFDVTFKWYHKLANAEDRLFNLGTLKRGKNRKIFVQEPFYGLIEDDHIPFLKRDVPILHLIGYPFPKEWHTTGDNADIINMDTVENINKILRVFVAEYLNMLVKS